MEKTYSELKEERFQKLLDDCKDKIIEQVIGPFGLSTAMFEDRNGGNVTTTHNFCRDDDNYIADRDKASFSEANRDYERDNYESKDWTKKSKDIRSSGVDAYTGKVTKAEDMDADHVTSAKKMSENKKAHLAFNTGESYEKMKDVTNHDDNIVATSKTINRSKSDKDITEFAEKNSERFDLDKEKIREAKDRSVKHINANIKKELFKKQSAELLKTGGMQAAKMGLQEGLGVLLVELVKGLFNEFVQLFKKGVEAGESLLKEMTARLKKVLTSVMKKIPDALDATVKGSISGFFSNLVTFLINNFISTAKRFVTMLRTSFSGLMRAFKLIFFPPKDMTKEEALQAGLTVLSTVVVTAIGSMLGEAISGFLSTVPVIQGFANTITPVLMGIGTGLLSVFIAYQIDNYFERKKMDSLVLDNLLENNRSQNAFLLSLESSCFQSLTNIQNYSNSIVMYDTISGHLSKAHDLSSATLLSLENINEQTALQISKSNKMTAYINETHDEIELFLSTRTNKGL